MKQKLFLSSFWLKKINNKVNSYLINEKHLPPIMYFIIFAYSHIQIQFNTSWSNQSLFIVAVLLIFTMNYNVLYGLAQLFFINHTFTSLTLFLICILSCNQKWKIILLIFSFGETFLTDQESIYVYISIGSGVICYQILQDLIFNDIKENVHYFLGFSAIFTFYATRYISSFIEVHIVSSIVITLAGIFFGYVIIQKKLQKLHQINFSQIRKPRVMAHYLKLIQNEIKDNYFKSSRIALHSLKCYKITCFCHDKNFCDKKIYFLRQLYEDSISNFQNNLDPLLIQYYINFLIKNEQVINTMHFLSKLDSKNYFIYIIKMKMKALLLYYNKDADSSNLYEKQYAYAFEYDQKRIKLLIDAYQIICKKLQFWKQISQENPKMIKLQTIGISIVEKMYKLNLFYKKIATKYEQNLNSFQATILYTMYLLSSTNFKQYGDELIKNTSRKLEEGLISQNRVLQTYAIRTFIRDSQKSFMKFEEEQFKMDVENNQNGQQSRYKLIIDNISTGFCRLLEIDRSKILGLQLNTIIPFGYRQVHNIRLSYLLDFESESLKEIVPSKVLHNQLVLPMKGNGNNLFIGKVCIKLHINLDQGLSFISILELNKSNSCYALLDHSGNITEKEANFYDDILEHNQFKKYFYKVSHICEEKFNIIMNSANYTVTLSSPLIGLFLQKQNLKNKNPPIHVQIRNQQAKHKKPSSIKTNEFEKERLKNANKQPMNVQTQSSIATSKKNTAAIAILSAFSENNSVKIYKYLFIVFFIVVLICFIGNLVGLFISSLSWNNTKINQNPISDTINMFKMQFLTVKTLLNVGDILNLILHSNEYNLSSLNNLYSGMSVFEVFKNLSASNMNEMSNAILQTLDDGSSLLQDAVEKKWQNLISFREIINNKSYNISMSYLDLMMNYVVDLSLLSKGHYFQHILMYSSFTPEVARAQIATDLIQIIKKDISQSQTNNIIVNCALGSVILILVIPLYVIFKKRVKLHEYVFDILTSIDSELAQNEINSLKYISKIFQNYNESSSRLKQNVLEYNQNNIHYSPQDRGNSCTNSLTIGLEQYDARKNQNIVQSTFYGKQKSTKRKQVQNNLQGTKKFQLQSKKNIEFRRRRRPGQLDLSESQGDPKNKIILKHTVLYLFVYCFLIFVAITTFRKSSFMKNINQTKDNILYTFSNQSNDNINFLTGKVFLRQAIQGINNTEVNSQIAGYWMQAILKQYPLYQYSKVQNDEIKIFQCNENQFVVNKQNCKFAYSYRILKGQYASLLKSLYQKKIIINTKNTQNTDPTKQATAEYINLQISQTLFYMQRINEQMNNLFESFVFSSINKLVNYTQEYLEDIKILLILALLWSIISFTFGYYIIYHMKKKYFQEVYIITFLNNDMIIKNKRIQSYLETLNRLASN